MGEVGIKDLNLIKKKQIVNSRLHFEFFIV
jgi:hypothetical protein